MHKPNLRPLDIILFLLLAATGIFLTVKGTRQKGTLVCVNANGINYEYSADKNGIYSVQGEIGLTVFEIKDGKVRIIDSPCPNKTCITQGWHNPLVCLPNKVMITIKSEGKFDAISE